MIRSLAAEPWSGRRRTLVRVESQARMTLVLRILSLDAAVAAFLFISAGRLDLPWFWAVLGLHAAMMFAALETAFT